MTAAPKKLFLLAAAGLLVLAQAALALEAPNGNLVDAGWLARNLEGGCLAMNPPRACSRSTA